ncbi:hypothetical protein EV363DRAFT_1539540 [Boletus edulis]|nr:hypothetical protein EV363DRAFT_1539540 [Boletus edulis]
MNFFQGSFATNATQKEMTIDSKIRALAFLPDEGLSIVSGEESTVQLRHLGDDLMGQPIEPSTGALAVAASKDGRWIVTGTTDGFAIWKRVERGVELVERHAIGAVRTIDISSDSKWVVTGSDDRTVDMWDISTGKRRLGSLKHEYNVVAVKFCPCGERLATATLFGSVRIYVPSSGQWQKLLTIPISVNSTLSSPNIAFAWFAHRPQLFAVSQGQIKCLNSDDGSLVFQWATRGVKHPSSVILSPNSKFIAYSINNAVVIRDTATRQQIGDTLKLEGDVSCIAFSPKSDFLVAAAGAKFIIWNLRQLPTDPSHFIDTTNELAKSCADHKQDLTKKPPPSTFSLPLMSISNGAVKAWLHDFLEYAEQVFTKEIEHSASADYNIYANRALIHGRRKNGDAALKDAEKSLSLQTSPIGVIARAVAFIQQGKYELAKQEIPKLLQTSHSKEHTFLLEVIRSILFCFSGEYTREISHLNRLSGDKKDRDLLLLLLVQANMHLSENCFDPATESFNKAHMPAVFPHDETREIGLAIQIQQEKCQFLLDAGEAEAAILFVEMRNTYQREIAMHVKLSDWTSEFRRTCLTKLEGLGDEALKSGEYKVAIKHYTAVEPLIGDLDAKHKLLLKRSEAHANIPENWEEALKDAEEAIKLDPSSPWGYDRKHVVLYARQYYRGAAEALDEMIKALVFSKDAKSTELREQGVDPGKTRQIVLEVVEKTFAHPRPHILVNTDSGRLCDKQKQTEAFRAHPQYKELILSPTSQVATNTVWQDAIKKYFRYSTFSHTWEDSDEPEFRHVENISVDRLPESFPTMKLKMFCKITHEHGYSWAWSDTCCINKADNNVLDMSLRSMYSWYSESSLTIVHLKGVLDQLEIDIDTLLDKLDELLQEFVGCKWNHRAWTLQEYFASKVIHFYTNDWKPYLPISPPSPNTKPTNHKDHRAIQQGMKRVTGLDSTRLAALKPGSGDVREKLRLASTRKATRREDTAYSLLGIFKLTLQAIYGDDEAPLALGRLLGALLTRSADVTILDWIASGDSRSEYNTCLPAEIVVYKSSESLHIPNPITEEALAASISAMSQVDIESAVKLHDRLHDALPPEFVHGRLKLQCISFPLPLVTRDPISGKYTATVELLDKVEFDTKDDLSCAQSMFLVHPWYRCMLGQGIPLTESERRESALKLLASLKQPFGALLLAWTARGYERMAADELITVVIRKDVSAEKLMENIRMLNVC